jgi:SnoaL-like domain
MDVAEEFVQRFAAFWADPSPEKMLTLLTPNVVLIQPLSAPMHGLDAAQADFRKLFAWLPDLRAAVDAWGVRGDALFIEFRLSATVGGRRVEWPVVDRFVLRGDKASRRVTYFDALPLLLAVLRAPGAWLGWWRSGAARPWGGR